MENKLYLCPTPIGNMEDMTLRALRVLRECTAVYCEDTRNTGALMGKLEISKPLISCHEHNERARAEEIGERVLNGEAIAFVSDAGMPGISDPGERLIAHCIEHDIPFEVLPGASASLTALITSGLPSREACFVGFLPRSGKERREAVARLARHKGSLIIYESPLRVADTTAELAQAWGDRQAVLLRELTKLYQEAVRSTLTGLAQTYADKPPKGEVVLVIAGAEEQSCEASLEETLARLLNEGVSAKDAAKQASALLDVSRNEAYKMALELQGK
ncbi:MAG: 16S rRNA (cytidine(1402)-2'-O)-methyltransferase [Clostridia bacterium]|nr:16S rRNA (cytidine(1402)-2'-O)-methyltransferase [Clostridia bacterium]